MALLTIIALAVVAGGLGGAVGYALVEAFGGIGWLLILPASIAIGTGVGRFIGRMTA